MYKEIKASEVKQVLTNLLKEKGWKKIKVWEQSLESPTPLAEKRIMWVGSKKYNYFFDGYGICSEETKDVGGKELNFVIDDERENNAILINCKEKQVKLQITNQPKIK
jgi:hypothetical protein